MSGLDNAVAPVSSDALSLVPLKHQPPKPPSAAGCSLQDAGELFIPIVDDGDGIVADQNMPKDLVGSPKKIDTGLHHGRQKHQVARQPLHKPTPLSSTPAKKKRKQEQEKDREDNNENGIENEKEEETAKKWRKGMPRPQAWYASEDVLDGQGQPYSSPFRQLSKPAAPPTSHQSKHGQSQTINPVQSPQATFDTSAVTIPTAVVPSLSLPCRKLPVGDLTIPRTPEQSGRLAQQLEDYRGNPTTAREAVLLHVQKREKKRELEEAALNNSWDFKGVQNINPHDYNGFDVSMYVGTSSGTSIPTPQRSRSIKRQRSNELGAVSGRDDGPQAGEQEGSGSEDSLVSMQLDWTADPGE